MNFIPSYKEMNKQEHFTAFLFGPVADILSLVPLQSSISVKKQLYCHSI